MGDADQPAWLESARFYYSRIQRERRDPVAVFAADESREVSEHNPGRLCMRLEPQASGLCVVAADGQTLGWIRHRGLFPLRRSVMLREGGLVWTLAVRSLVRKRHVLQLADGDRWTFDTPFFWWQHLTGTVHEAPSVVGRVGPTKEFWMLRIQPGMDSVELLAAIACLHRQWWRS
jgi:hypothetical protein